MLRAFHRLKVSQKLTLISVLFMIPDSVLLCLFLVSINSNIQFATSEVNGNKYQLPLENLLAELPTHLLLTQSGAREDRADLAANEARIDEELRRLESMDAQLGEQLQFTDEGLSKRQREHCRTSVLQSEWKRLKDAWPTLPPETLTERHRHLMADVRTMITHVGDNSNLILDPDLDSYYLMDVTLLALPAMQSRIAAVEADGLSALSQPALTSAQRRHLAVAAALLEEADLNRVRSSAQTALNEDANFYGVSETLRARLAPALDEFVTAARAFIQLNARLGEAENGAPSVTAGEYLAIGEKARASSFALWRVGSEELDRLLVKRIEHYENRRAKSLILTALALIAAVSFVAFITYSISGPLQRQAAALQNSNEALQAEIAGRQRIEIALRAAEARYRSIFENAVEGVFQTTPDGRYLAANPALARMYGYDSPEQMAAGVTDIHSRLYVDPKRRTEFEREVIQHGQVQGFESEVYRKDGTVIWISEHARVVREEDGKILYYEGIVEDITARKHNEAELKRVHAELVNASRLAGMAEVATGVLHNVGNVLNSVNVAAHFVADRIRKSRLGDVGRIAGLLREHEAELGPFFATNPKGRRLVTFIGQLGEKLAIERDTLLENMEGLRTHLNHINEIVAMQQSYARVASVTETISLANLVEDALQFHSGALCRHQIDVRRNCDDAIVTVDKHRVLQVLINLISNAKYACSASGRADRQVSVHASRGADRVQIAVVDNGVGIAPENLVRIFGHGFTTKRDGHGFGLHSSALAAKEMGGTLRVHSDGPGLGATFTLEIPGQPLKAA